MCNWETTLIASLIGVLVGSFLSYLISLNILKRQNFNKAVAKFRSAFIETERAIDLKHKIKNNYGKGEFIYELVLPQISEQEKAKIKFSPFLKSKDRNDFDIAWMKYAYPNWYDEIDDPQIEYKSNHVDEQENIRKLLRERLTRIYNYASYK